MTSPTSYGYYETLRRAGNCGMAALDREIHDNLAEKEVLVWGDSDIRNRLINYLTSSANGQDGPKNIFVYSTRFAGRFLVKATPITSWEQLPAHFKENGYVFLVHRDQTRYLEGAKKLASLEFKNIIQGIEYYEHVTARKMLEDYETFKNLNTSDSEWETDDNAARFLLDDLYEPASGDISPGYLYQDIWCANKIFHTRPAVHYDIGSRMEGFITHLLSFEIKTVLIDIRPFPLKIENLDFIKEDATSLSGIADDSIASLSALHSLEHFGLGRYGDPIDPWGYKKAFLNMQRVVKPKGDLYISFPVSKTPFLSFNNARYFNAEQIILEEFADMELVEFSCVLRGSHEFVRNCPFERIGEGDNTGMFHFRKP